MGKITQKIKKSSLLGLRVYNDLFALKVKINYWLYSDRKMICKWYKDSIGRYPDLDNPKTLTEKLQWIKLHDRRDLCTICADKYEVRSYLKEKFGEDYLVPLLYVTDDYRSITSDVIPDEHCILKANHDCGHYIIIRDKKILNYPLLREKCRGWLMINFYEKTREWQYKNIPRKIIIEKLLETSKGKIPNDYKLHFFNGKLEFIYVSYDREGVNDRCVYDKDWNRLPFVWIPSDTYRPGMNTTDVPKPSTFEKMVEMGTEIAKDFKYVRVDYYDVDGKLYFGEITLIHGAGYDKFFPEEYDEYYGSRLKL